MIFLSARIHESVVMSPISRRNLIQSSVLSMSLTLSGCNAIRKNTRQPLKLIIFNTTTESYSVELQLLHENERIAQQNLEITAGRPNNGTRIETTIWRQYKPKSAEFKLKYRVGEIEEVENLSMNCVQELKGGSLILRISEGTELDVDTSCID